MSSQPPGLRGGIRAAPAREVTSESAALAVPSARQRPKLSSCGAASKGGTGVQVGDVVAETPEERARATDRAKPVEHPSRVRGDRGLVEDDPV